ncbi:acid protease [Cryphonectria parasitica EP155]|uniref:Acid protease n=1 Tax=Cryphonectria parasitica (strain ATCC 38755 / EP155) TaxID=660469 RepID=A0A9P4Y2E3_CRYP1|nr:acid protease [Cryphonectria parasitica EP155]KAF3765742.1 acid protease [Cryphonectria parasitica EP155]
MSAFKLGLLLFITVVSSSPSFLSRYYDGFSLNTIRNVDYNPNGVVAKQKAMFKYAHLVNSDASVFDTAPGEVSGFVEANDREWLCPVGIGTPAQTVNLDLDTGSADLDSDAASVDSWVFSPDSGTRKGQLGNRRVYDAANSTTSGPINGSSWSISYGDGSYAGGKVYTDVVQIAGLRVSNATVEVASSYSSNLVKDDAPLSGLMGLAINLTTTATPAMPPMLSQLKAQNIKHIAVDLQFHANGTYTFGTVDHSAYLGKMTYRPVKPGKGYWWIELQTMRVGQSNKTMIHSWDTIVDTGTSLFLGPSDIVRAYYKAVPTAEYSQGDNAYVFPCNTTLPDFHFGFSNDWSEFTVPGRFMNYSIAPVAGAPWCYGGIQESNMGFSIMGDVFLKAVYLDFNVANQTVGFASKPLYI